MGFKEDAAAAAADVINALGEEVTFNGLHGPVTVKGVFDPEDLAHEDFSGNADYSPAVLEVKSADFEKVRNHDTVTIGMKVYEVLKSENDGFGSVRLMLQKIRDDS
ncbi:MAG: hypothetical protein HS130_00905 [Deltaproteobacteria bacterium]|nr:hypothetical protein [Deltaproteobacteria bacterium]MCL4873854.1 hypothetical protein [bacterium]